MISLPHRQGVVRAYPDVSLCIGGEHFDDLAFQPGAQDEGFGFLAVLHANLMLAAQIPDAALVIGAVLAARESARQRDILPVPLLPCPSARQKFPITKDKDDPAWRRPQQALGLIGVGEGEAEAQIG